jgi:hypothetical protein
MGRPAVDVTGQRFFRLVAIERVAESPPSWRCRCDCGGEKVVAGRNLRSGGVKSCGCWNRETGVIAGRVNGKVNTLRHGHTRNGRPTPEYTCWQNMWARCRNPKNPKYADYGGRGIKVCDRWRDYAAFLADMGPQPPPLGWGLSWSVDRIDNDGNYEPGNCRWATPRDQRHNRRDADKLRR